MFLFVSRSCFLPTGASKAGLLALLLTASIPGYAQPAENPGSDASPPDPRLSDEDLKNYRFPHWPQHQQVNREIIPPPPPGPYMSSALSDYSVQAPSFGRNPDHYERRYHPAHHHDMASAPMDIFSPDIPWPENLRPGRHNAPDRWMPESGYQYVKPYPSQKSFSLSPQNMPPMSVPSRNKPPGGRQANRRYSADYYAPRSYGQPPYGPYGMNRHGNRKMFPAGPSIRMAPPGPYSLPPAYGQRNGGSNMYNNMNSVNPQYSGRGQ